MVGDTKLQPPIPAGPGAPAGALPDATFLSRARTAFQYPMTNNTTFMLFIAFVVARYIQIGARRDILATIRFEFLLGIAVVIIGLVQMGSRQPVIGRARPLLVLISLLFFAMVIQLPFAAAPIVAQTVFMDRVIKFAILTFLMVAMIGSPRQLRWFLLAFLFSIFYIALESVRGLISGGLVWENQGIPRLHGAVPIYAHPNSLGGVTMGTLPFVAFLMPHFRKWWQRAWLLAVAASSLVCVIYSGSRTAYVGLFAFVFWWWLQSRKKVKFLVWGLVFGALSVMILPRDYIERFESIGGHEKEGASKATRIVILQDAWAILQKYPMGVGIASFPAVRYREFGRSQDTHNLYLEVGTNLGVGGLAVFLGLVGAIMLALRRTGISFTLQMRRLQAARSQLKARPWLGKYGEAHLRDLRFLLATGQAAGGFVFVRLVLGLFGMDLYEVYWWFGAGLAIVLSGLEVRTRRITHVLLETAGQLPAGPNR